MQELQLLLFIYLFLLSIWLVNVSPSLCFESLCILACEMGLDVAHRWVLAVLIGGFSLFKLGLLPFDVNWLFCPFVDVNSSLYLCSLLFGIFLERLILVVPFYV